MDRAAILALLELLERHAAQGALRIARLQRVVDQAHQHGSDATEYISLLRLSEEAQRLRSDYRIQLWRELEEMKSQKIGAEQSRCAET